MTARRCGLPDARAALACWAAILQVAAFAEPAAARAVDTSRRTVAGISVHVADIDLRDPATILDILLANNAPEANRKGRSYGDESFDRLAARAGAAVVVNGTFFSKDREKRIMGNMVGAGRVLRYSEWEDQGTTFGLLPGNRPELETAFADRQPDVSRYWLAITAGPRLLRQGQIWLRPAEESFKDSHVLGTGARTALGFDAAGSSLLLVTFLQAVTLRREAEVMRLLGCHEAMNLDGGASRALAVAGKTVVPAGRKLTNVLAVYDASHPAPGTLASRWSAFVPGRGPTASRWPGSRRARPAEGGAGQGFMAWLREKPLERRRSGYQPGRASSREIASEPAGERSHAGEPRAEGMPAMRHLRRGQAFEFAGLAFRHVSSDPIVGVRDGVLSFGDRSYGAVYAALGRDLRRAAVEFEARLVDEFWQLTVSGAPHGGQLAGTAIEYRERHPLGIYLRTDGHPQTWYRDFSPDHDWHRFRIEVTPGQAVILMDRRRLIQGATGRLGTGIGLSGRGEFRNLRVE